MISTPNHAWDVEPDERLQARRPDVDTGHALAGPIEVRGAKAGQTLVVRIEEVRPAHWGVTHGGENHAVYWDLRAGIGRALDRELDLKPFLGVMGMPPPEPGVHSTIPPRRWGGNLDCKELVAGSTLYLPIPVDGALFSAGDGHAAQGDGEVSGTAIETPAQARLTLDVDEEPSARVARRAGSGAPGSRSAWTSISAGRRRSPSTGWSRSWAASSGSSAATRSSSRASASTCT